MNTKKLLLGSLFVGGALALTRLLFSKPASVKPAFTSTSFDAIDNYIEEQMRRLHIPGISLAVVEGDRIVHLRGFGRARPGGEAPTPQTPFFIGSLTKSFTATLAGVLVERGQLSWTSTVGDLVGPVKARKFAAVTLTDLLSHRAGLPANLPPAQTDRKSVV